MCRDRKAGSADHRPRRQTGVEGAQQAEILHCRRDGDVIVNQTNYGEFDNAVRRANLRHADELATLVTERQTREPGNAVTRFHAIAIVRCGPVSSR